MPEKRDHKGDWLKDIILGGQDGLVNVLALVLGVSAAVSEARIVLIAGLAGTFAESISMGAVAYTSTKAAKEYYLSKLKQERLEIQQLPDLEKEEIHDIYFRKGFRGKLLQEIVHKITSRKKLWLDTMMTEELQLLPSQYENPLRAGWIVGLASFGGSIIPLLPFFLFSVSTGRIVALFFSLVILFALGAIKARFTNQSWIKGGIEIAGIGIIAALMGHFVGVLLGAY